MLLFSVQTCNIAGWFVLFGKKIFLGKRKNTVKLLLFHKNVYQKQDVQTHMGDGMRQEGQVFGMGLEGQDPLVFKM